MGRGVGLGGWGAMGGGGELLEWGGESGEGVVLRESEPPPTARDVRSPLQLSFATRAHP